LTVRDGKFEVSIKILTHSLLKGHPTDKWEKILAFLREQNVDVEEAQKNPATLISHLYKLDMDTLFGTAPQPVRPFVVHLIFSQGSPVKELPRRSAVTTTTTSTTRTTSVDKSTVDHFLVGLLISLLVLFLGRIL
jgi:hypothetical protein